MQREEWTAEEKQKQRDQSEGYRNGQVANENGLDNNEGCGKSGPILEIF